MSLQNVEVAYLNRCNKHSDFTDITLMAALVTVSGDRFKIEIERLRDIRAKDIPAYKELRKKILPAIAFNGTFNSNVEKIYFNQSSDLFHFDIDGLEPANLANDKARLASLPSTVFCFVSPSGAGLKGALRIEHGLIKNDADFKRVYQHAEKMIAGIGHTLDTTCKDVSRLCFVSYDPDIYVNYDAEIFPIPEAQAEIKPAPPKKPKPKEKA